MQFQARVRRQQRRNRRDPRSGDASALSPPGWTTSPPAGPVQCLQPRRKPAVSARTLAEPRDGVAVLAPGVGRGPARDRTGGQARHQPGGFGVGEATAAWARGSPATRSCQAGAQPARLGAFGEGDVAEYAPARLRREARSAQVVEQGQRAGADHAQARQPSPGAAVRSASARRRRHSPGESSRQRLRTARTPPPARSARRPPHRRARCPGWRREDAARGAAGAVAKPRSALTAVQPRTFLLSLVTGHPMGGGGGAPARRGADVALSSRVGAAAARGEGRPSSDDDAA